MLTTLIVSTLVAASAAGATAPSLDHDFLLLMRTEFKTNACDVIKREHQPDLKTGDRVGGSFFVQCKPGKDEHYQLSTTWFEGSSFQQGSSVIPLSLWIQPGDHTCSNTPSDNGFVPWNNHAPYLGSGQSTYSYCLVMENGPIGTIWPISGVIDATIGDPEERNHVKQKPVLAVRFAHNRSDLSQEQIQQLTALHQHYLSDPSVMISLHAHTSEPGTPGYNQSLSVERLRSVRTWLVEQGWEPSRIWGQAWGESQPYALNVGDEYEAFNRQVVLSVEHSIPAKTDGFVSDPDVVQINTLSPPPIFQEH